MKGKIVLIVGVVVIIISTIFAAFTDVANDIPALIGIAFGLGLDTIAVWKKSEKKNGLVLAAIISAIIGGLCCAFAGLSEATTTSLVIAATGLVALLVSILTGVFAIKKK